MLQRKKSNSMVSIRNSQSGIVSENSLNITTIKAFTRWCNEQLKNQNIIIFNLSEDIQDGIKFIKLIEKLSGQLIGKYNKKPKFRAQKLENIEMAITFLQKDNSIKIVGISSQNFVNGDLKLILGLIWQLIVHFQIRSFFSDSPKGQTPKQSLLKWLQETLSDHPVGVPINFTTDWSDGRRLAALCDTFAPGYFPKAEKLNPHDSFEIIKRVIEFASEYLGVTALLEPEDISNCNVDERSMILYLSEFLRAKPLQNSTNQNGSLEHIEVDIYGPAFEEEIEIGKQATFFISPFFNSPLIVNLQSQDGRVFDVPANPDDSNSRYFCDFALNEAGIFSVIVYNSQGVRISAPNIFIKILESSLRQDHNLEQIHIYGPGIENDNHIVDEQCIYTINTGNMDGELAIEVTGPKGPLTENELEVNENDGKFDVIFTPIICGNYNSEIYFNNQPILGSPFTIVVLPHEINIERVHVHGEGLSRGIVGTDLSFTIDTREAGHASIDVALEGPVKCIADYKDHGDGTCEVTYCPTKVGIYKITILFEQENITGSPFLVAICDPSLVVVSGSGISKSPSIVHQPLQINSDLTESQTGELVASYYTPSGNSYLITFDENDEKNFTAFFQPNEVGYYTIHIDLCSVPILGSPFRVPVIDPKMVEFKGNGLKSGQVNRENVIEVYTSKAGPGELNILFHEYNTASPVNVTIEPLNDTKYLISYYPSHSGRYKFITYWSNFVAAEYEIDVSDKTKFEVTGPGIGPELMINQETYFKVNLENTGIKNLDINISLQKNYEDVVYYKRQKLGPNCVLIKYTPTKPVLHYISLTSNGNHIADSPYIIEPTSFPDIKLYGNGLKEAIVGRKTEFFIDTENSSSGSLGLTLEGPSKTNVKFEQMDNKDIYRVEYTPTIPGIYYLIVNFSGIQLSESPFEISVTRDKPDASKVVVSGMENLGQFFVDASKAGGSGMLNCGVTGEYQPSDFVSMQHLGNFKYKVTYEVSESEDQIINVLWHGVEVPKSPFIVKFVP